MATIQNKIEAGCALAANPITRCNEEMQCDGGIIDKWQLQHLVETALVGAFGDKHRKAIRASLEANIQDWTETRKRWAEKEANEQYIKTMMADLEAA